MNRGSAASNTAYASRSKRTNVTLSISGLRSSSSAVVPTAMRAARSSGKAKAPVEIAGVRSREAHDRARGWLGRVGLAAFGDRYPHALSGGQRKRVALAQVLIRDPEILPAKRIRRGRHL